MSTTPNTPRDLTYFNVNDLVPDDEEEQAAAEPECDCPFPWWWIVLAAAVGGGVGYYAGQRKRPEDELPIDEAP